jgi:hypothetical protein
MGGGLSKHEDEMRAEQEHRELPSAVPTLNKAIEVAASDAYGVTNESRCPMKRGDGSYTFDWWKVLTCPQFPHGPSGKKPIAEEEVRQLVKDGVPSSSQSVLNASNGTGSDQCPVSHDNARKEDGCPVKHSEYNVYSQPIDPKNNMPKIANQLPAPGQSKELPTERVHSTIPKVCEHCLRRLLKNPVFVSKNNEGVERVALSLILRFLFGFTGRNGQLHVDVSISANVLQRLGSQR